MKLRFRSFYRQFLETSKQRLNLLIPVFVINIFVAKQTIFNPSIIVQFTDLKFMEQLYCFIRKLFILYIKAESFKETHLEFQPRFLFNIWFPFEITRDSF